MQNKQEVKVEKQSKSNAGFVFLVIMLIAIIMVSSSMGLYAWARYSTKTPGNTTGQVAKWHFELKPGKVEGTPLVNFAITRTDGYSYVEPERLAPGTFGIIPMEIDTTETEVTMTYEVKVQLKDCPANIKFYKDSGKTEQLERTKVTIDGEIYDVITISRYLSLDMVGEEPNKHTEVNDVHNETIYWEWPYQTIVEENGVQNAVAGDMQDTQDQGKTVMMNIVVTGIQVTKEPKPKLSELTRANAVNYYGDIVDYHAGGLKYRLFYIDWDNYFGDGAGTIYLMADKGLSNTTELTTSYIPVNTKGYNGYTDLSVFENMNKKWKKADGVINKDNEKAAGWLCSPSKWTQYAGDDQYSSYVNYAIGSPSVELYIASYNEKYKKENETELDVVGSKVDEGGLGYKYWPGNNDEYGDISEYAIINKELGNGMYYKRSWLASPSVYQATFICSVEQSGGAAYLTCNSSGGMPPHYAYPVISLQSNAPIEIE